MGKRLLIICSARIPQIIKNYQDKSCEGEPGHALPSRPTKTNSVTGLALLFFLFSLTGNSTYGLSLLSYSQNKEDILKALPWLIGSLGTVVEDCIIFFQFRLYADRGQPKGSQAA